MGSALVALIVAVAAGIMSFFSPCVLPIVPVYLSLISGMTFEEMQDQEAVRAARWRLLGSALGFMLGFSLVVVLLLGGLVEVFSSTGQAWKTAFSWIGAGVIMIFGLHMLGVFRLNMLFQERRFHLDTKKVGVFGAVLIGAAFAFGWSPCIGPFLSGVLGMTVVTAKLSLLVAYTIGLAVPFLLAAMFLQFFLGSLGKITRHMRTIEIVSGILLLVMGVLLVTQKLEYANLPYAYQLLMAKVHHVVTHLRGAAK